MRMIKIAVPDECTSDLEGPCPCLSHDGIHLYCRLFKEPAWVTPSGKIAPCPSCKNVEKRIGQPSKVRIEQ